MQKFYLSTYLLEPSTRVLWFQVLLTTTTRPGDAVQAEQGSTFFWCYHFSRPILLWPFLASPILLLGPFWSGPFWLEFHENNFYFFQFFNFFNLYFFRLFF